MLGLVVTSTNNVQAMLLAQQCWWLSPMLMLMLSMIHVDQEWPRKEMGGDWWPTMVAMPQLMNSKQQCLLAVSTTYSIKEIHYQVSHWLLTKFNQQSCQQCCVLDQKCLWCWRPRMVVVTKEDEQTIMLSNVDDDNGNGTVQAPQECHAKMLTMLNAIKSKWWSWWLLLLVRPGPGSWWLMPLTRRMLTDTDQSQRILTNNASHYQHYQC